MTKSESLFEKAWRKESKDVEFYENEDKFLALAWMWTGWRRAIEMMEKDDKSND